MINRATYPYFSPSISIGRCAVLVCLMLSMSAGLRALAGPGLAPGEFELVLRDGRVTLEAARAPLAAVIEAIAAQAEFEAIMTGDLDLPTTISLNDAPLPVALDALLRGIDRFIVYAPARPDAAQRVLQRLWLFAPSAAPPGEAAVADVEPLFEHLDHEDARIRSEALLRLAGAGGATAEVLDHLGAALKNDNDALARSRAAIALGKLADRRALSLLESALEDEHRTVRLQATHALAQIGGEGATGLLGDILLHSSESAQRVVAAAGLWRQDTEQAQRFLDAVADDSDQQVRAAAAAPPRSPPVTGGNASRS